MTTETFDLGQLFITGISGTSLSQEEEKFILENHIGGIILFSKNYESPEQLSQLCNSIQKLRHDYPLFISVDNEGGRVFRFKTDFFKPPPMLDLSLLDSPKICFEIHSIMAQELLSCGVNLDFSPTCDILLNEKNSVIGDRAFGRDEETVVKFITSAIRGLQANGVIACAKHFPGHGRTVEDSHDKLAHLNITLEELEKTEIIPFLRAIKSSRVATVMMAHILVPCLDKENPASLSPTLYKYLRNELKFTGPIISDDMQMGAIVNSYGKDEAPIKALEAGVDILVYRDLDEAKIAYESVMNAYSRNALDKSEMLTKLKRIELLKKEFLKNYKPIYIPDIKKIIGKKQNQVFLNEIERRIQEIKSKNI